LRSGKGTGFVKRKRLLDSFALLAYLNKDNGFRMVHEALASAQAVGDLLLMNEINVGEVYYILQRRRGRDKAEYFLDTTLPALPITTVANTFYDVIAAARVKAEYPIAFADCFAVATAQPRKAIIMTGDPEFKSVEHLVDIEWLDG
jgi:uncharacterized protein